MDVFDRISTLRFLHILLVVLVHFFLCFLFMFYVFGHILHMNAVLGVISQRPIVSFRYEDMLLKQLSLSQ